jgi:hypothetical protein
MIERKEHSVIGLGCGPPRGQSQPWYSNSNIIQHQHVFIDFACAVQQYREESGCPPELDDVVVQNEGLDNDMGNKLLFPHNKGEHQTQAVSLNFMLQIFLVS